MADKKVKCAECGNDRQFDEDVRGACYTNRYYLQRWGSELNFMTGQKHFDVTDAVYFKCVVCGADLDEMELDTPDENGDATMKDRLLTKYRESFEVERVKKEKTIELIRWKIKEVKDSELIGHYLNGLLDDVLKLTETLGME